MFSFLGLALTYILENSFKPEAGARPGVSKIGILITDGKSQDDVIPPAKNLRDAGIELFAIGVYSAISMYMSHCTLVFLYLLLAVLRKCSFLPVFIINHIIINLYLLSELLVTLLLYLEFNSILGCYIFMGQLKRCHLHWQKLH